MESNSTSFPQGPFSFLPKRYKKVNMDWALQTRPITHDFQLSLASITTDEYFKPWLEFLCHIHLFIRAESNAKYDQSVITITETQVIDTACVHTAKFFFQKDEE